MLNKENTKLPRSTPEAQGIQSTAIIELLEQIKESGIEFHHLTIIRHGKVIAQGSWKPYDIDKPIMLHSLTKLFTNTAIGMACEEGLLSLDDKVMSFFPDELPEEVNEKLEAMTVRDLITMRCGHARGISGNEWRPIKTSWVAQFFKEPIVYKPGEVMRYSSATSYMLSAIIQKVTGGTVHKYLWSHLFEPLGITGEFWDLCPHGINSGGNGLTIKNEDVAKVGLVYLNGGVFEGRRYLSEKWVQEAMYDLPERKSGNSSYGFHMIHENDIISSGGFFGQTLAILPAEDMVVSLNAALLDNAPNSLDEKMRIMLEETIIAGACTEALPGDITAQTMLDEQLASLTIPAVSGHIHSIKQNIYSGTYIAKDNEDGIEELSFMFLPEGCQFSMKDMHGTHELRCGANTWRISDSSMTGHYLHHQYQPESAPVAANGSWATPNVYVMRWVWLNMTFVDTVICTFKENKVSFKRIVNVNTQSLERPEISAKHKENRDRRETLLRMETQY